jgi:hypothetical protein
MSETPRNDPDAPNYEHKERDCDLGRCGCTAIETVVHPQRGRMAACELHAWRIDHLPAAPFDEVSA